MSSYAYFSESPSGDHPMPVPETPFAADDDPHMAQVEIADDGPIFTRRIIVTAPSLQLLLDAVGKDPAIGDLKGEQLVSALVAQRVIHKVERFSGNLLTNGRNGEAAYQRFDPQGALSEERYLERGHLVPSGKDFGDAQVLEYGPKGYVIRSLHYNAQNELDDETSGDPAVREYNQNGMSAGSYYTRGEFVRQMTQQDIADLAKTTKARAESKRSALAAADVTEKFHGTIRVIRPSTPRGM